MKLHRNRLSGIEQCFWVSNKLAIVASLVKTAEQKTIMLLVLTCCVRTARWYVVADAAAIVTDELFISRRVWPHTTTHWCDAVFLCYFKFLKIILYPRLAMSVCLYRQFEWEISVVCKQNWFCLTYIYDNNHDYVATELTHSVQYTEQMPNVYARAQ